RCPRGACEDEEEGDREEAATHRQNSLQRRPESFSWQSKIASPRRWFPRDSTMRTGPKNGPVRSPIAFDLNVNLYCVGASGFGRILMNVGLSVFRHETVPFPFVTHSAGVQVVVWSTPSFDGGFTSARASFTRSEMPCAPVNAPPAEPGTSRSPPPFTALLSLRSEFRRRITSRVMLNSKPGSNSASQTRSSFASPPPPSTQLPALHVSGTEHV